MAVVVGVVLALAPIGPWVTRSAGGQATPGPIDYDPPVVAPITDPFRPPPRPWLPGNRGIEYATTPGTPVRSAGAGRVSFAGSVAGALHVTVAHADGVRTSYSYLASIAVPAGAEVAKGHVVGTSGTRLHVGARRGDTYIDPASLWGLDGPPWVRLAPSDVAPERRRPARRWPWGRLVAAKGPSPRLDPRPWHQVRVTTTPQPGPPTVVVPTASGPGDAKPLGKETTCQISPS